MNEQLKQISAGCMTTESDTLSGTQTFDLSITGLSFCCLFINGRGHLQPLSSLNTDLNHNPIK